MYNAYIKGTGSYVPDNIVKNDFFEAVGSSDQWIYNTLGIKERRIVKAETTSDLAYQAALKAIKDANLSVDAIELIVLATATPDRLAPSCACFVQEKLGALNAVAFDISAVCSGALFATSIANQFIKTGMYKNALVIGADTFSNITDWGRRDSVFFGDGAGAIVISRTTENKGFIEFQMFSDGRGKEHFTIPAGGSEIPTSHQTLKDKLHYFQMNGKAVFDTASKVVPETIKSILKNNNLHIDDIKYLLPHQPSIGILKKIAKEIEMPFEKVKTNMDRYANTSGGTIPILLDEVNKNNQFQKGDNLLFAAVGAGWTWGSALYKW
ncbi:MAG: ketoacyl-ACP synthase III [Winogradskyella sp.]|jgi:3-oxoacyl-[acyl-carrier-protein] synthase-3|nr:ketoacyl-ACP synthase III [Winogradskyella sp.]